MAGKKPNKYAELDGKIIKIFFPFDPALISKVKQIPGWKFKGGKSPYWICPVSSKAVRILKENDFDLGKGLFNADKPAPKQERRTKLKIPGLKGTLRHFQEEGVQFIESKNGRALIADEMGTGKTMQALGWLQLHPELRPAVMIVPATAKINWRNEIVIWMSKMDIQILSGEIPSEELHGDIVIVNYDIAKHWQDVIKKYNPKVLILDECHKIKNEKAQRTKAVKAIAKGCDYVIALSGTPMLSRPVELFTTLHIIAPQVFPNYYAYVHRYCGAKRVSVPMWDKKLKKRVFRQVWDFTGASHMDGLHEKLATIMIRRKKKDVLPELPPKQRIPISVLMDTKTQATYDSVEDNFLKWVLKTQGKKKKLSASRAQALTKIEALKQLTVKGKMKQAIAWINDYLEINDKLVIFATHTKVIKELTTKLKKHRPVVIDGSTPNEQRPANVYTFQTNDKCKVFIGNIQAAGTAITLTAASAVLFIEMAWTPGEMDQAEDRIHRIGQEADSVIAYYMIAENTVDGYIMDLLDEKRKILDAIIDGKQTDPGDLLNELIIKLKEAT